MTENIPNNPMVETYKLTIEHYVSTSNASKIRIENNQVYQFSFCIGSETEVFGKRNQAIGELMKRATLDMINNLEKENKK